MKTILLVMIALCIVTLHTHAQTEKGKGFIGGSFSFGTSKQNNSTPSLNTLTLTPQGGYFLANNLAIGLALPLNLSKLRGLNYTVWDDEQGFYVDTYGPKEFSFGISPFIRKYIDVKKNLKFFAQANLLMQINTFNRIDDEGYLIRTDAKIKGLGASASPGFAFFINRHTNLEFSFPVVTFFHQNYYDAESMYNFDRKNNLRFALDNFTPTFGINYQF
ncbi:hypothetical protein [Pedobacter rhizosphaerae]|uniref:Outer membrane protein beta-barrel domain-containing protein n=1 Tax=Pedobacter rhizosphaerae TaxID=390241 RepID=A0A1H9JR12_9SPHI|nr:hypothetical protein [Pedobacter rhizosphaerae]SEQ89272.1 hypothetical protein SAMN04488023_10234 [Pedobacter rhizosphaerae]